MNSFSENEKNNIKLTSLKEFSESGGQLERGHLTVVQIPNVPHHVFASLLLASNRNRVVPLGAGDGFYDGPQSGNSFRADYRGVEYSQCQGSVSDSPSGSPSPEVGFFSHMQNLRRVYSPIPQSPSTWLARSRYFATKAFSARPSLKFPI
ncbi:MAG: hypothetical protein IPM97_00110 [Bdellovibrionaceae bacterium]|nr:hypothetical protein [Pseudobdellovibrionaceae bacterium]